MSKQLTIVIPDSYNEQHVKERIEMAFNSNPLIVVSNTESVSKQVADALMAIAELQQKLKEQPHDQ